MKILVTGASGWIGTWLVPALVGAGHYVIGVDPAPYPQHIDGFEFVHSGLVWALLNTHPPEKAIDDLGVDVVVPLQGLLGSAESVKEPVTSLVDSVKLNLMLLDAISRSGSRPLIVFLSSDLCYREPSRCIYSLHKKTVEGYLRIFNRVHDIPYVILRMATGYGPLQKRQSVVNYYIRRALAGETIPVHGDGKNRQAFIYIEDAVKCIQLACEAERGLNVLYPLIGQNLKIVDLAQAVVDVLGGEIEHVEPPVLADKVSVGDLPVEDFGPRGCRPEVDIYEGIRRTAEWMKEAQPLS